MTGAEHPLVRLAAEAISAFLTRRQTIEPPEWLFLEVPEALLPAGVFVCLKREGHLRGCIGTTEPSRRTMAAEVIEIAIGAATRDPRFPPLESVELEELEISVDVLTPSERVWSLQALDHRRYGIVIRSGERHSVLLPDLEGINSVAQQVEAAREKAGIGPEDIIEMLRFEVTRYR
jgi:AmmeMemoRadiSam system protein A